MKIIIVSLLLLSLSTCTSSTLSNNKHSQDVAREQQKNAGLGEHSSNGAEVKLYPVDEGLNDPSFREFRERLIEAARRRDSKFILSILDPHILNSLGGNGGVEEFREMWMIDDPSSKFWDEFTSVLSMGGSFHNNHNIKVFCAPYISSKWETIIHKIPNSQGIYQYAAIVNEDVSVRQRPDPTSPIIATLSYDIVKMDYTDSVADNATEDNIKWIKITTLDNKEGFVSRESIRSPSDYHICFNKEDGKWVITIFAAGD